jgi:hypothetical protein
MDPFGVEVFQFNQDNPFMDLENAVYHRKPHSGPLSNFFDS